MVSRRQIDAAKPELVLGLIESWRTTAVDLETCADDYMRVMERPGGQAWSGQTAEAAITTSHADRLQIVRGADAINGMADGAYRGVTELVMPRLTNVRAMIDNAERQGFVVNDDLSVSWTRPAGISDATAEVSGNHRTVFPADQGRRARVVGRRAAGVRADEPRPQRAGQHHLRRETSEPEAKSQAVDRTWKEDPTPAEPPMSREQAAAGLKDVNQRIWQHNHIEKPYIESLPANDSRRADFHIDTDLLNREKQQYLDILPKQHPPANLTGPSGVNLPGVPPGLISENPARSGQGWIYPISPNQPGIDPRVVSIRIMEPSSRYPNGYLNYLNGAGQEVDPFTGRTVPPTDPFSHIPIPN